jgi:excisionase family DNA binding protein
VDDSNQKEPVQSTLPRKSGQAVVNSFPFEPLLTPAEAAAHLRVHQKTVIRLARLGQLPGLRLGKHHRFRRIDLEQWTASKVSSFCQPDSE